MTVPQCIDRLRTLLGPDRLRTGDRIPPFYRRDMLTPNRGFETPDDGWTPAAVAKPQTTAEVAIAVRIARESGANLVCWGGGTGLMGSAAPLHGEIVLDLGGMDRIEIDLDSRRAIAQAGARLQAVEDQAALKGLILGHDPWTVASATVGGSISTNGIGYLAPRYGSMGQTVLGVTLVLPDGTVALQRPALYASGLSLVPLAVGMEGSLGVVTEAVLRLRVLPERRELVAFGFPDFASGFHASREISEIGPSLFDWIEPHEAGSRLMPDDDGDYQPTLYLAFEGRSGVVEAQAREAERIAREFDGARRKPEVAQRYWDERHEIAERFVRDSNGRSSGEGFTRKFWLDYVHVALPAGQVLEFRARALRALARHALQPAECACFVHPDLFNVYFVKPRGDDETSERREVEAALEEMIRDAHELGGRMEYCHGVGARLSKFLRADAGAAVDVYARIKSVLDPHGVLPLLGRSKY